MDSEFASILRMILLLHIQGSLGLRHLTVTCEKESICALRGSEVYLSCSYFHRNIQTVMWFNPKHKAQWRSEDHPEDLALDSDYAGRVDYIETTNSTCRLRMRDVKERDSGEYRLLFFTTNGQTYLSSTAVNITVTDIQVMTHPGSMHRKEQPVNLICHTSCKLNNFWCIWNKNGQRVDTTSYWNSEPLVLSSSDGGSYSCSIKDSGKRVYSPAVCVLDKNCLDVTYTDRRVCALEGSTVDIPCTFSYPSDQTVIETYWSYNQIDIKYLKQFTDRIEYTGDHKKNCTLRLTSLKQTDSGNYQFHTASRVFHDYLGVQLTVTGVAVRAVTLSGQTVVLSCRTTCSLSENTNYIWYKNGQPITNKFTKYNKLYLDLPNYKKTDNYTCAVKGSKPDNISNGEWWTHTAVGAAVGAIAVLLLFLLFAVLYIRWMRGKKTGADNQTHSEDCVGKISVPTLTPISNKTRMVPMNNTYVTMNPANLSASDTGVYTVRLKRDPESVYETMQRKDSA